MDLSEATTYAGIRFHRSHERFSHVIKTTVLSLVLLKEQLDNNISKEQLEKKVWAAGGKKLWGGMPAWNEPYVMMEEANTAVGNDGVSRAFSAFDLFLEDLNGEMESWGTFCKKNKLLSKNDDESDENENRETDKLFRFLKKKKWTLADTEVFRPIYQYFRISRDCNSHRNGLASPTLVEISKSYSLANAVAQWKKIKNHATLLPIRKMETDGTINFTHQDAIMAYDLLRRIALEMNVLAIKEFGLKGIVYLIAQKDILAKRVLIKDKLGRDCYSYIYTMLVSTFSVKSLAKRQVTACLKEIGISKECYDLYRSYRGKILGKKEARKKKPRIRG